MKKNVVEDSRIKAGGNVHIGDVIYQDSTSEAIALSKELATLKASLSAHKLKVLVETQSIDTALEHGMLQLLNLLSEEDAKVLLILYQAVVKMPWREVAAIQEALENQISTIKEPKAILDIFKAGLMPKDAISKKLRCSLLLIPLMETTEHINNDNPLLDLWSSCREIDLKTT